MKKKKASKTTNKLILAIAIIVILLGVSAYFTGIGGLRKAEIISPGCDFTTLGIDQIQTVSNEPSLNYEKAYLITVRADKGGECFKVQLAQDDFAKFGIKDFLFQNITLTGKVNDLSLDYKVYDDAVLYKIYESIGTADLSDPIPYNSVSLETTQLSALGKYSDPNGQAPPLSHLGSFPSGGDVNLMKDVGKWALIEKEASNIPFGKDPGGNWWVLHMGGVPYYRGYYIDTMAINKYSVLFALTNSENEMLAKTTMDEQNRIGALSDIARIKFAGSDIDAAFPPQPARYFYLVQGLEGTPVKDKWKFVSSYRYESYKANLDQLVNFDNNYFVRTWSDMSGMLVINSTPSAVDVYMDNKYLGFTPLTLTDVPIGRHTITAKKKGYFDAEQAINLNPTVNKLNIVMAKIPPPDVTISASPNPIIQGSTSTITWSVSGVFDSVLFYDPNPKSALSVGSQSVSPQQSTTYSIVAKGEGGDKTASVRLQVDPPPPPPPPPPVRRDPGVGREALTAYENNLNNMLGLMASEQVAPQDCLFNEYSLVVTCRPQLPIAYPKFQIVIKAKAVAMEINSGLPNIGKVTLTEPLYEGTPLQALVEIKNLGIVPDSFDLSLQSSPALSAGTQQSSLTPNQTATVAIPFSGAKGNYSAKIVLQSRNNPFAKAVKQVEINIIEKPLPEEIKKLEKQTDYLEDLIAKGYSKLIQVLMIIGVFIVIAVVIYLKRRK